MKGFTVYLSDGSYLEFPSAGDPAPALVEWFRDAEADRVVTLNTDNGVVHVQKRHITRIAVLQS